MKIIKVVHQVNPIFNYSLTSIQFELDGGIGYNLCLSSSDTIDINIIDLIGRVGSQIEKRNYREPPKCIYSLYALHLSLSKELDCDEYKIFTFNTIEVGV